GSSTMTTSPSAAASAVGRTRRPADAAASHDLEPSRRPTRTSCPESFRLSACAWPWLPNPRIAIRMSSLACRLVCYGLVESRRSDTASGPLPDGLRARRLPQSLADALVAPGERDPAGPHELHHAEVPEQVEERLQLLGLAGDLEREGRARHVHHVRAEDRRDLHDALAGFPAGPDLDQHELAFDGLAGLELEDLDHVDELVELLGDLLERLAVDANHDRHSGQVVVAGGPHRERVDVEPARREQAGDAREHARLVLHQHRDRVQAPVHATGASSGSYTGLRPSGPRTMSSFDAPAGTIGKHISRGSTRKSITTLRSSTDSAFSITGSTSSG